MVSRASTLLKDILWETFSPPQAAEAVEGGTEQTASDAPAAFLQAQEAEGKDRNRADGTQSSSSRSSSFKRSKEDLRTVDAQMLLLYLCVDQDQFAGIGKAVAAVTRSPLSGSSFITPEQVQAIAYPMGGSRQLASIGRYVLTDEEIAAAVCAAHACRAAGGGAEGATIQGKVMEQQAVAAGGSAIRPEHLMHGAACERLVTLLLGRYKWHDVYIAARH